MTDTEIYNLLTPEENERRLRYKKIDSQIVNLLNEDDYVFYVEGIHKGAFQNYEEAIKIKDRLISELEDQLRVRKLDVEALKKENEIIWKSSVEKLAEERFKNKELELKWEDLLRSNSK